MESFFFNTAEGAYKKSSLYKKGREHITRVDISNGIVFIDIALFANERRTYRIKGLDRMMVISVTKEGLFTIREHLHDASFAIGSNSIDFFLSSRQNFTLTLHPKKSEIFILFIADFILKRYITPNRNDLITSLYAMLQSDIALQRLDTRSIDAMTLYLIEKITDEHSLEAMRAVICERDILEFLIHRFKLLDIDDDDFDKEELSIATKARDTLLRTFVTPPTIKELSHICATNETRLKELFKRRYKTTIYNYIQKLRLEKANLLLKERSLSVGDVAKAVGYKHQGHFSKLFYNYYGVYPKDLLKSQ